MFVRLAIAGDEDLVVQMIRDSVRETTPDEPVDETVIRERFRQYLRTSFPTVFVLEQNRRLIGVASADMGDFDHRAGFFIVFKLLYVLPEKRGTRAAVLLTSHLVRWADQLGAGEILGGNDNGFRPEQMATFLERFGFQRVGFTMKRSHGRQINAEGQQ